ncbi:hypothetical protein [Weissella halotolerans]|uniref:Reductase n=1 Tax=Weissella halotolerans DSM 20190 TaxID=1123500 RepID=A0A0R2FYV5_9LACO|nr:hypothetical protein [Weissella halotolerans]KRN33376.1 hypothetical protein IV68_GL000174 [Weissella halotolerans DSM 20190]
MLVNVKKDQPKIAIGLLSYLPAFHKFAAAQQEYAWYQADSKRDLLLWQDEATHHMTALVGIEEAYHTIVVRLIVVGAEVPRNRRRAVRQVVLDALQQQYPNQVIMGTMTTQKMITRWRQQDHG